MAGNGMGFCHQFSIRFDGNTSVAMSRKSHRDDIRWNSELPAGCDHNTDVSTDYFGAEADATRFVPMAYSERSLRM